MIHKNEIMHYLSIKLLRHVCSVDLEINITRIGIWIAVHVKCPICFMYTTKGSYLEDHSNRQQALNILNTDHVQPWNRMTIQEGIAIVVDTEEPLSDDQFRAYCKANNMEYPLRRLTEVEFVMYCRKYGLLDVSKGCNLFDRKIRPDY